MPEILKILAIDDDADTARMIAALAASAFPGAKILSATGGADGLELARAEDPHVILLDIVMPGLDGFEVCRRLKADPRTEYIPVIFLTGLKIGKELRVQALEAGGEGFLSKPVEQEELTAQVRAMVKIKTGGAALRREHERLARLLEQRTHELAEETGGHKRAEEELRESREIFSEFMEHSPIYVFFKDENIRSVRLSRNFETLLGKPLAELLGKSMDELFPSELARSMVADDALILKDGKEITVEEELNGRVYSTSKFPIDFEGRKRYLAGYTIDITERKRAETAALRRAELLAAINSSGDLRGLMRKATGLLREWSGCAAAAVRLRDGEDFPYFETRGLPEGFAAEKSQLCSIGPDGQLCRDGGGKAVLEGVCGAVLYGRFDSALPYFTGKGSFRGNSGGELRAAAGEPCCRMRQHNCCAEVYESMALIPLRTGLEIVGLLQLSDPRKGCFDDELMVFLEYCADQLAIAVAHFNAQAALRGSEARLRKAQTVARVGNWEANLKTGKVWASEEARLIYGYAQGEKLTLDLVRKAPLAKYRPALDQAFARFAAGEGSYDQEFEITQQNTGETLWLHSKAELAIDNDGTPKVVGVLQDITERKRAEAAFSASEIQFQTIFDQARDSILVLELSPNGSPLIRDANAAALRMRGYTREELLGKPVSVLDVDGDNSALITGRRRQQSAATGAVFEVRHKRKDGSVFLAESSVREITVGGRGLVIDISRDITERRQAEDELKAGLAEKDLLLKEIHHRVKNSMQLVAGMLTLQSANIKDEAALAAFRDSRSRLGAIGLMHEILYKSRDLARLNMREYAGKVLDGIRAANRAGEHVGFKADICDCPLSADTAVALGLILNELVSNALRHAFTDGRNGVITVVLYREGGGYCLSVEDNGPGLPADYDLKRARTLGMQLAAMLAGQISGTVTAVPAKGARFLVRFPGDGR